MIVSYCLNPSCTKPQNHPKQKFCKTCGASLILHNRYRAVKRIGKGGFGATFLAFDLSLPKNPLCVIKQLLAPTDNPENFQMALDLFKREANALEKINHPQVPNLLDYFGEKQQFYLVQSLIKGRNLRQEVKQNGVFSEMATKRFLVEMLPVIKYLHSIQIIHRDIKPANIIRRDKDGQLILIDFGAVKDKVNFQLLNNADQTVFTKFSIGTVGFAPPEQLAMRPVYSSDLYALGATCLYLMTGKSPKNFSFDELTGQLLWEKEVQVSSNFAKVLRKILQIDVCKRFQTADEVMKALDIAPYEQELQENLISKTPSSKPIISSSSSSIVNEDDNSHTSATVRLARAIRARKSRQGKSKFLLNVTPQTLLMAYANGRKDFSNQKLNQLNLAYSNLSGSKFSNCQLINANLENANLTKVNFYRCDLSGAILQKANLQQTYLHKANLENADLRGADLRQADLTSSNLRGANLCGADLTDAKVEDNQLKSTKTNWSTIFPEGKRRLWH